MKSPSAKRCRWRTQFLNRTSARRCTFGGQLPLRTAPSGLRNMRFDASAGQSGWLPS